jgi:hypothetical protein
LTSSIASTQSPKSSNVRSASFSGRNLVHRQLYWLLPSKSTAHPLSPLLLWAHAPEAAPHKPLHPPANERNVGPSSSLAGPENSRILLKISQKVTMEERKLLTRAAEVFSFSTESTLAPKPKRLESFCVRPESSLLILSTGSPPPPWFPPFKGDFVCWFYFEKEKWFYYYWRLGLFCFLVYDF